MGVLVVVGLSLDVSVAVAGSSVLATSPCGEIAPPLASSSEARAGAQALSNTKRINPLISQNFCIPVSFSSPKNVFLNKGATSRVQRSSSMQNIPKHFL
jgi:hypothetical protein